jgi:ferredoxin
MGDNYRCADCNDRKCGRCAACRGLVRDGDYAALPAPKERT